jgi:hypothetical protein
MRPHVGRYLEDLKVVTRLVADRTLTAQAGAAY